MDLVLVDTSWLLHRSKYAFKDLGVTLSNGDFLPSGHLFGVLQTVKKISKAMPDAKIVCCLDGKFIRGRELDKEYKANRTHSGYDPYSDLGVLVAMLSTFPNVSVAFNPKLEADELISGYVSNFRNCGFDRVIMFSADNDLLQLLGEGVYFSNKFAQGEFELVGVSEYMESSSMFDKYVGTSIEALPLFRALVGDSSDNLKGFPRLRKRLAREWAEEYLNADSLISAFERSPSAFPVGFSQFTSKLRSNFSIMKLRSASELEADGLVPSLVRSADIQNGVCQNLFILYRMKSLLDFTSSEAPSEDCLLKLRDNINAWWSTRVNGC